MSATVDFFFSFRSPYSYLAGPRAFALADKYDVKVEFRPIRPMVTRGIPLPMSKKLYILLDAAREAERLGMDFGKIHDPIGDGALRCLYVSQYAKPIGKERAFVLRASRAIWAERTCMVEDKGLRISCQEVGLEWDKCLDAINDDGIKESIENNNAMLRELKQWGVPTFHIDGNVFWGQDRIDDLEALLKERCLAKT